MLFIKIVAPLVYASVHDQAHRLIAGRGLAQLAAHRRGDSLGVRLCTGIDMHMCSALSTTMAPWVLNVTSLNNRGQRLEPGRRAQVHQARQFRQPRHLALNRGNIADVGVTVEWHQVVFTHRVELNIFD